MRKLLIASLFAVSAFSAKAQLTSEHTYTGVQQLTVVSLEDIGEMYSMYDTNAKAIRLSTASHTTYKSIPITIPSGCMFGGYSAISTKLIDLDAGIELAYIYYNPTTTQWTANVVDDNGSVLNSIPGCSGLIPAKIDNKWKILGIMPSLYQVWSVPGSMPAVKIAPPGGGDDEVASAFYPNPMNSVATLKYSLPQGTTEGTIDIYNTSGQKLRSYQVGSQFSDILIQRGELPAGTYVYQLRAGDAPPEAKTFVIQ